MVVRCGLVDGTRDVRASETKREKREPRKLNDRGRVKLSKRGLAEYCSPTERSN